MRTTSLIDQLFIKAKRIRNIEDKKVNKVGESIEDEFVGIVNYCLITLIVLNDLQDDAESQITSKKLLEFYNKQVTITRDLMLIKNHDYGEAWRDMRISTFTDMILARLLRIKEIEDNGGKTSVSEGIDSNLRDMMNYAIFALIRINENNIKK
jgi:hypothetical protein